VQNLFWTLCTKYY